MHAFAGTSTRKVGYASQSSVSESTEKPSQNGSSQTSNSQSQVSAFKKTLNLEASNNSKYVPKRENHRWWWFTLNNPDRLISQKTGKEVSLSEAKKWIQDRLGNFSKTDSEGKRPLKWALVAYEIAPTTQTPHCHIIMQFTAPASFQMVQKMWFGWPAKIQFIEQNLIHQKIAYLVQNPKKPDPQWWSTDNKTGLTETQGQGKRTDIENAIDDIKKFGYEGAADIHAQVLLKYPSGFEKVASHAARKLPKPLPQVTWIYGDAGLGKTSLALKWSNIAKFELWTANQNCKWFDGYDPIKHKAVLFDDIRNDPRNPGNYWSQDTMQKICDEHKGQFEVKGSNINWVPELIFITSPVHPRIMYNEGDANTYAQLARRITKVLKFVGQWQYVEDSKLGPAPAHSFKNVFEFQPDHLSAPRTAPLLDDLMAMTNKRVAQDDLVSEQAKKRVVSPVEILKPEPVVLTAKIIIPGECREWVRLKYMTFRHCVNTLKDIDNLFEWQVEMQSDRELRELYEEKISDLANANAEDWDQGIIDCENLENVAKKFRVLKARTCSEWDRHAHPFGKTRLRDLTMEDIDDEFPPTETTWISKSSKSPNFNIVPETQSHTSSSSA